MTNRFYDFLMKCIVLFAMFVLPLLIIFALVTSSIKNTDSKTMHKLLNYSRETIEEKEKYFKLKDVPDFEIYPLGKNEFKVVFINGEIK